jgi:urease accessory protein
MESMPLLRVLQLFDSQFPVGAFAHSGGLETYGQSGAGLSALRELMTNQVALGWGRSEIAAACLAWSAASSPNALERLTRLSALTGACKVIPGVRDTSIRLGRRTLTLLRRLHPDLLGTLDIDPPHHAVIIGAAGRRLDVPRRELLLAYGQSLLAGALAAATRCMPVSPGQAQELIVELQPRLAEAVERAMRTPEDMLFTCTPALDVRCHQQLRLHTRLFQS